MSPRPARAIRLVLNLPRLPKQMDRTQRLSYRLAKRRYAKLPWNARHLFLDNVAALNGLVTS